MDETDGVTVVDASARTHAQQDLRAWEGDEAGEGQQPQSRGRQHVNVKANLTNAEVQARSGDSIVTCVLLEEAHTHDAHTTTVDTQRY